MLRNKKLMLARACEASGMTRLVEALPHRPVLLILNYHRVGDAAATPYDSNNYSCTTSEFAWQTRYLKKNFQVVSLEEATSIVHGRSTPSAASVLITFDDGYRDNYDEAFPVLRDEGLSATFFLPTAFIGTGTLPWWDVIAYIVKGSRTNRIKLTYPDTVELEIDPTGPAKAIKEVLALFKRSATTDVERFLGELETACGCERPQTSAERCFLNWDEAREMQRAGMCFGSHTHTHAILSKLPVIQQTHELQVSRDILEHELGRTIDTLAYPVGKPHTFSSDTYAALRNARYNTAFSFFSGVNQPGKIDPFNVRRFYLPPCPSVFRFEMSVRAVTARNIS